MTDLAYTVVVVAFAFVCGGLGFKVWDAYAWWRERRRPHIFYEEDFRKDLKK